MDHKYAPIEEDNDGINETKRNCRYVWRWDLVFAIFITTVLSSLITLGIVSLQFHKTPTTVSEAAHELSCGSTHEEAHQRGCTFDALSVSWLPPQCSRHGQSEFLSAAGNSSAWHYYRDQAGLIEIPNIADAPPGSTYWTTQKEHLHHCMWMLLRFHDAALKGGRVDRVARHYGHARHCLDMMVMQAERGLGEEGLERVGINGDTGFNVC